MSCLLKPLSECGLDELVGLENQSFTSDRISKQSFRRLQKSPSADGVGAFDGSDFLGYSLLLFRSNSNKARLYSLAVDRKCRGKGIGRALLEASIHRARERHCVSLQLEVSPVNTSAIQLYESLGFKLFSRRAEYYEDGNDALVYRFSL